jgi:hypothetical protein
MLIGEKIFHLNLNGFPSNQELLRKVSDVFKIAKTNSLGQYFRSILGFGKCPNVVFLHLYGSKNEAKMLDKNIRAIQELSPNYMSGICWDTCKVTSVEKETKQMYVTCLILDLVADKFP